MRTLLYLIIIATSMTGCVFSNKTTSKALAGQNILKTDSIGTFSLLKVNTVASINVIYNADSTGIILYDMPQSVFDNLNVHTNNDTLIIGAKDDTKEIRDEKVLISIYASEPLKECMLNGVGDINIGKNTTDSIFAISLEGVGNFNATDLIATEVTATLKGVGNINIIGSTKSASYTLDGVGDIIAKRLIASNVKAYNSGVGNIKCHASETFCGQSSGVGNIECSGSPSHTEASGNNITIK